MTCRHCTAAADRPAHPFYTAGCVDCGIRELAQSPEFHAGGMDGGDAKPYRKRLSLVFGDAWRDGHQHVLACAARIKKAKATT